MNQEEVKMQAEPINQLVVPKEIVRLRVTYPDVIAAIPPNQRSRFVVNNELIIRTAQDYKAFSELKIPLYTKPGGALKRLLKDIEVFMGDAVYETYCGIELFDDSDHLKWHYKLKGPQNSPYEGGIFTLLFIFTTDHPFKPPKVRFETRMYHPRLLDDGRFYCSCGMLFCNDWSPAYFSKNIIDQIVKMMTNVLVSPYEYGCCPSEKTALLQSDPARFVEIAKEWTKLYAK